MTVDDSNDAAEGAKPIQAACEQVFSIASSARQKLFARFRTLARARVHLPFTLKTKSASKRSGLPSLT
jgi:hypothetical protein